MIEIEAIAGINPKTKICEIVGKNTEDTWNDIRKNAYIAVPCKLEQAKELWTKEIPNIYALHTQERCSACGAWHRYGESSLCNH